MAEGPERAKVSRKLAAILAADIAGYSALMGADEARTVRDLKGHQATIFPLISDYGGRVIDTAGDGVLAEFGSVVNAVECAVAIQKTMGERNASIAPARRMLLRMGVNLGDVIHDDTRVYGDGVNIAARLESIAEPGGICLSGEAFAQVQRKLPLNFTDLGEQQLKNIAQPIRVYRIERQQPAFAVPSLKPALTLPDKPSIAVLPFANLAGDPKEDYFSDGITEDIITELSRFSELFVIAGNSSFTYKGRAVDVRQVGRELGVRYVLEGSVRRAGDRVRITGQLIDASTGAHRWAERYDRKLEDVFALQDEVARTIVAILFAHVRKAEAERTLTKPPSTWQAYDFYLRANEALTTFMSSFRAEDLYEARNLGERSVVCDRSFARGYALVAISHLLSYLHFLDDDYLNQAAIKRAHELARKAVQFDPNSSQAHVCLGTVLTWVRDYDESIAEFERAISLNPNFSDSRFAGTLVLAGQTLRAIDVARAHMRLDPFYVPLTPAWVGLAYYMLERYDDALPFIRECASRAPNLRSGHALLAATYAQLGRLSEAQKEVTEVIRITPNYSLRIQEQLTAFRSPADWQRLKSGLLKAGFRE